MGFIRQKVPFDAACRIYIYPAFSVAVSVRPLSGRGHRFDRDRSVKNVVKSRRVSLWVRRLRENRATTIAAMFFLGLIATITWNLCRLPRDARLDAIRQKGYPVTLSELNSWYPAVPVSENNAPIYERVFALPGFREAGYITWPGTGRALTARERDELREVVVSNRVALAMLHSAQASNRSRYSRDLSQILSANLNPTNWNHFAVLQGVRLLIAEALLHAANGDSDQVVQSFKAAGVLADSMEQEPLLLAQVIRLGSWNMMVPRVEQALALTPMTEEQLASLQAMLAAAERPQALLRGLAGDRAIGIAAFAHPVNALANSRPQNSVTECLKNDLVVGLSKTAGIFERDRTFYLETIGKAVDAASLPFPERLTLGQQTLTGGAAPRFSSISPMVLPRTSSIFAEEANLVARLRAAQVALALERLRCRHDGRLPASLEELTPDFCKALPVDPFDGQPLRLEVLDSGYAIFTSGTDPGDGTPVGFRIYWQGDGPHP
jgi:hypothetical protein